MTKDNSAYFTQRATEEMDAAKSATSAAAARVHRELSLRYALKRILPEPASADDDGRTIGQPRCVPAKHAAQPAQTPARRRSGT